MKKEKLKIIIIGALHDPYWKTLEKMVHNICPHAEIKSYINALDAYYYVDTHRNSIGLIIANLLIKPFNNTKFMEMTRHSLSMLYPYIVLTESESAELHYYVEKEGAWKCQQRPSNQENVKKMIEETFCIEDADPDQNDFCDEPCICEWCIRNNIDKIKRNHLNE